MWHSVISVSGIKVRYNPFTQELRLTCAKRVAIRLNELSDFYVIQVSLSSPKPSYPIPEKDPPNPPKWLKLSGRRLAPLKRATNPPLPKTDVMPLDFH